ncbi:MAG: glycosyltransferase family 39 protein [Gammaproteobacteria bacterium]|nr:glycosyltransferase family 39 protein [Gammaproteobacteria bacterium]
MLPNVQFNRLLTANPAINGPWIPVIVIAALCINGIWWGGTEIWNADQMAFKDFFRDGHLPFSPPKFNKPPLLAYMNFAFSVVPREIIVRSLEFLNDTQYGNSLDYIGVWLAKTLQLLFAVGSVYLLWRVVAGFSDNNTALVSAMLLASSAGFVIQAHLITTDLPLVFFVLLAFAASQKVFTEGRLRDYALAGLLIGLTGAMKYNGLVIGLALPVFHCFRTCRSGVIPTIAHPYLFAGVLLVPVGFLLGNPFAIIEFERFAFDLGYLFATSSEFIGAGGDALRQPRLFEILADDLAGRILILAAVIAVPVSIVLQFRTRKLSLASASVCAALLTALVYGAYLYPKTNVQVRWVLPILPLVLIGIAPVWAALRLRSPRIFAGATVVLVGYGLICSAWVGHRFTSDPRFDAIAWVDENVPDGATIESSTYTPNWNKHRRIDVVDVSMPSVTGRSRAYEVAFADNSELLRRTRQEEKEDPEDIAWYSLPALEARNPDYVAVSSLYYDRFLSGELESLYPELNRYFVSLLNGNSTYRVVFDQKCCKPVKYLYPREILFVDNRIVILGRD